MQEEGKKCLTPGCAQKNLPPKTMLGIHVLYAWQESKGQCVYSTFRSSISTEEEFSMEFCPNTDKSSQQTPREPFPALEAFKQYDATLQKIS